MSARAAIEFPPSSELPPPGSVVVLRLLPLPIPPMTVQEAEARVAGSPPPVLWNLTARDGGGWTAGPQGPVCTRPATHQVAFSVTADDPVLAVRGAVALCQQWNWGYAVQELTLQEIALLGQQQLPIPPSPLVLIPQPLPDQDSARDLYQFCAEVWTWMDEQGIRDAWRSMLAVGKAPEEQRAALLAALPPSMRTGPDAAGNYRGACGARRTPGPALIGPPCTSGARCLHTATGLCWRRWSIDPDRAPVELVGEMEPAAFEVEQAEIQPQAEVQPQAEPEVQMPAEAVAEPKPKKRRAERAAAGKAAGSAVEQ